MKKTWIPIIGKCILVVVIIAVVVLAYFGYRLYLLSKPPQPQDQVTPDKVLVSFEQVDFRSVDGLSLSGWFLRGVAKGPVLILCHKLGVSKDSLLNLAIPLQKAGYNVFLFDFRNSGESKGNISSFGILEARDVIGAIDYLMTRNDIDQNKMGVFGVEMGAYAAALAALERKNVKVLAFDSLYPDMKFYFMENLFDESRFAERYISFIPIFVYSVYFRVNPSEKRAADAVKQLSDRNLLFIVGMGDREMMNATRQFYHSVQETKDSDKNLLELPRSLSLELYGDDKKNYDQKILSFFNTYLPVEKPKQTRR